jgi:hypothetical protein
MESRIARLEEDMRDVRSVLSRLEPGLATRAEVADLRTEVSKEIADLCNAMILRFAEVPTRTYLWGILGVLITAYDAGLAALAVIK